MMLLQGVFWFQMQTILQSLRIAGNVCASEGYTLNSKATVLGEIEVPDEIVEEAQRLVRAKIQLNARLDEIEQLIQSAKK